MGIKKAEAKKAIESLITDWLHDHCDVDILKTWPSVSKFMDWAEASGYGGYFRFRTTTSVRYDVEMWLDQAVKE